MEQLSRIIERNSLKFNFKGDRSRVIEIVRNTIAKCPLCKKVSPRFICLAGLPGCGKTEFCKLNHLDSIYLVVDPDEYRIISNIDSLSDNIIEDTHDIMCVITMSVLEIAFELQLDVLIMDTFSNKQFWLKFFSDHKNLLSQYEITMIILAQPYNLCKRLITRRYENDIKSNKSFVRPPDYGFLNECRLNFSEAMEAILNIQIFSSVKLLTRQNFHQIYNEYISNDFIEDWNKITNTE